MTEMEDCSGTSKGPTGNGNDAHSPHGENLVKADAVDIDVSWLISPDLQAIDVLARLHVVAYRSGRSLWLHGASGPLIELFELVGLRETVHLCPCVSRIGNRFGHMPQN